MDPICAQIELLLYEKLDERLGFNIPTEAGAGKLRSVVPLFASVTVFGLSELGRPLAGEARKVSALLAGFTLRTRPSF